MKTSLYLLAAFGLMCPAVAQQKEKERSKVLQTSERIRKLERRQKDVGRQLGSASGKIESLLRDLKSNDLEEKGKSGDINKMNGSLLEVKDDLPTAEATLATARAKIENAYPHLDTAGTQVSQIILDLSRILNASETAILAEDLLREIRELIKRETFIWRETKEWGKVLILSPEIAAADKPRVARAQGEVVRSLDQFDDALKEALEKVSDAMLSRRFKKGMGIIEEKNPAGSLRRALAFIDQGDVPGATEAVQRQAEAIEILKEIERALSTDDDELARKEDLLEELKRILDEQIDLKEEVEEAGDALKDASELQADQLELKDELDEAAQESPTDALEEASDAMEEASDEIGEGDQDSALAAQDEAIEQLQDAIGDLESEIADAAAEAGSEAADGAGDSFAEASESFGDSFSDALPADFFSDSFPSDGFPSDGFPSDGFPSDGFPSEGAGLPAPGSSPTPGAGPPGPPAPGAGPPAPGIGPPSSVPGQGMPVPGSFAPAPPGVLPDDPQIDSTGYSSTTPMGDAVSRTRMSKSSVERRRRNLVIQKYVQQLPVEFRNQARQYFEILAK
ncbi:hypothetical protein OAK38_07385 [Verrucomicrobia bacterium]|nr:hypothetical protein [Verrucomicrobiota bacterium]